MKEIRFTLLAEGSSDKALLPILTWLLYQHCREYAVQSQWADLRRLPRPPKDLTKKIKTSVEYYRCDLLFVHRDADKDSRKKRADEIRQALADTIHPPAVCVVPVRMTEAWLLSDEIAIRKAARNPNGQQPLQLPNIDNLEKLPDPKLILYDLLRFASGITNRRRLRRLAVNTLALRVPDFTKSFERLRELSAFKDFESELLEIVMEQGWNP